MKDDFTVSRDSSCEPGGKAAEGIDVFAVGFGVDGFADIFGEFVYTDTGVGDEAAVGELFPLGLLVVEVVFVFYFADEFFDEVFAGDESVYAAEFVDDESEVSSSDAHESEEVEVSHGWGCEDDGSEEVFEICVGLGIGGCFAEEVFDVEESEDVVEGVLKDGESGVSALTDDFECIAAGGFDIEGDDICARDHVFFDGAIFSEDEVMEDGLFGIVEWEDGL